MPTAIWSTFRKRNVKPANLAVEYRERTCGKTNLAVYYRKHTCNGSNVAVGYDGKVAANAMVLPSLRYRNRV